VLYAQASAAAAQRQPRLSRCSPTSPLPECPIETVVSGFPGLTAHQRNAGFTREKLGYMGIGRLGLESGQAAAFMHEIHSNEPDVALNRNLGTQRVTPKG